MPFKFKRMDTVLNPEHSVRRNLRTGDVVARINKIKAVAFALLLVAFAFFEGEERVMAVGAGAADGADGKLARGELMLVFVSLSCPGTVKGEHGIVVCVKVDLHTHQRLDCKRLIAFVVKPYASCNDVAFFKNRIEKMKLTF